MPPEPRLNTSIRTVAYAMTEIAVFCLETLIFGLS